MPIVLQEAFRSLHYIPFYVAIALDAYAEEGVDVRLTTSTRLSDAMDRVLSGEADLAWGGPLRVIQEYDTSAAADVVCFCEVVPRDPFFLVGRVANGNFSFKDLLGKRLAIVAPIPTPWLCLEDDLRRAGVDPHEVNLVRCNTLSEVAMALREERADAAHLLDPFVQELVSDGSGHVWSAAASRGLTTYTSFYIQRRVLVNRSAELKRMVRAMYRTQKWLHAAPGSRIAETIADYFPTVLRKHLVGAIERYKSHQLWNITPKLEKDGYDRLKASLLAGQFVQRDTSFAQAVDNSLAMQVIEQDPPALIR